MDCQNTQARRQRARNQISRLTRCAVCGSRDLRFNGFRKLTSGLMRRRLICHQCGHTQYSRSALRKMMADKRKRERERIDKLLTFALEFPEAFVFGNNRNPAL
jgi:hypothetical protein